MSMRGEESGYFDCFDLGAQVAVPVHHGQFPARDAVLPAPARMRENEQCADSRILTSSQAAPARAQRINVCGLTRA